MDTVRGNKWGVVAGVSLGVSALLLGVLYALLLMVVVLSGGEGVHPALFLLPLVGPAAGAALGGLPLVVPAVRRADRRAALGLFTLGLLLGTLAEWATLLGRYYWQH